jgi:hypothetical protein
MKRKGSNKCKGQIKKPWKSKSVNHNSRILVNEDVSNQDLKKVIRTIRGRKTMMGGTKMFKCRIKMLIKDGMTRMRDLRRRVGANLGGKTMKMTCKFSAK